MLTTSKNHAGRAGFTLVELLTVMAIIALLIGLMVPALGHVKTTAKVIQQKAQLKSMESALEAFSAAYGDYPPSAQTYLDQDPLTLGAGTQITCGAQKLAEALIGVDIRGFDPRASTFVGTGGVTTSKSFDRKAIEIDRYAYAVAGVNGATTGPSPVTDDPADSLSRRKGPYITVNENVNSFELKDIFGDNGTNKVYMGGAPGRDPSNAAAAKKFGNVICDNFKVKNITYSSWDYSTATPTKVDVTAKVGTPILYFKADSSKKKLDASADPSATANNTIEDSIYNWHDNMNLVSLGRITDAKPHYWMDNANPARSGAPAGNADAWAFYSYIQNPKIGTGRWPYNPDSYLLISAGPDGIYGTADDITNFGSMDMK